jgi:glycosyltransferase involved in cell wall biosynthesis
VKLLFLCHSLNVGGLETYILRFAKWLSQHHPEHRLELLCKAQQLGSYERDFRELKVPIHAIPMGYFDPLPYLGFRSLLKSGQYDAVCDFGGDFGALPMLVSRASGVGNRLVFYRSARNAYSATKAKLLYQRMLNRLVKSSCTWILSNSREAFDFYFAGYPAGKDRRFRVIRNGIPTPAALDEGRRVDLRRALGVPQGHKVVLHVGSGRWEKNHSCMLQMARYAQDNGDQATFYFAGPGVERICRSEADRLELGNVRFLGERRDVADLLQVADLFLFPSLSEGQPNALLEAMTNGVPFVASDIAPVRESLPPEWGGEWLFPPEAPGEGYRLLRQHLDGASAEAPDFPGLVEWSRMTYNDNARFEEFLHCLAAPGS